MSNDLWRWADPDGQQRRVRLDELRAALAGGHIAPNTPVWRAGWRTWQSAHEVPELTSSALSAANGVVPNIPPPPLAMVAMQHEFEAKQGGSFSPPPLREPQRRAAAASSLRSAAGEAELDPASCAELGTLLGGPALRARPLAGDGAARSRDGRRSVHSVEPAHDDRPASAAGDARARDAQSGRGGRLGSANAPPSASGERRTREGPDDRGAERLDAARRQCSAARHRRRDARVFAQPSAGGAAGSLSNRIRPGEQDRRSPATDRSDPARGRAARA